jgi:tetratricopeptide (TPR) repeat protein
MSSISSDYSIFHYPSKEDSIFCKNYSKLITAEPTKKNHIDYHSLACSLWQLGRLTEAENMFLKILASNEPYYVGTYYNSSDIPGDTTTNTYGYGSYTSNYKNYACRYLTKIYIEEKKFDQALKYIEYADKKYIVEQNCGRGYMRYQGEIDGLYSLTYEGLGMHDSIINMFLPQYSNHSNSTLTRALKKVYSQTEINEYLKVAENSIVCVVDTFQSSTFITQNYGEKDEITTEIKYTSGTATMNLFGRQVTLPRPNLENGEIATRELFVKRFKESGFYKVLIDHE